MDENVKFGEMAIFFKCFWYLISISSIGFFVGRLVPKHWFAWNQFPYNPLRFEKNGKLYKKLMVHRWHKYAPDMSKVVKRMPAKGIKGEVNEETILLMIRETCIAEWTHCLLGLFGFVCISIWPGGGGLVLALIYLLLGHLPYIIIQRYNRPRLVRLMYKMRVAEERELCAEAQSSYVRGA